jgi:hypothetical protein
VREAPRRHGVHRPRPLRRQNRQPPLRPGRGSGSLPPPP